MNVRLGVASVAVVLSLAAAHEASGSLTIFTSRPAWLAALGGVPTTEVFATNQTFVVGNNFYNSVNYRIYGPTVGGNSISGGLLNGDIFTSGGQPYGPEIVLPGAVSGWGSDFNGAATASGLILTLNTGDTVTLSSHLPNPGTGFLGWISTVPFTTVHIGGPASPNEIYSMDNMSYGVPAPGAGALVAAAGLVAMRRRRR